MKKIFTLITLMLIFISSTVYAEKPDISANSKSFDFSTGCYILKGNVRVVARGRTMTADEAKVQIPTQKVWANGNVTLSQSGYSFKCDSIYVQGKQKTVDVLGNAHFIQPQIINITSNVGQFSWDSKVATFHGIVNLTVYDKSKLTFAEDINPNDVGGYYSRVQYHVRENKIISLER